MKLISKLLLSFALCCVFVGAGIGRLDARERGRPSSGDTVEKCVECHAKATPNVVNDWKLSKHSTSGIGCEACHGSDHSTAQDAAKAKIPTPETCGQCHADRVEQFKKGKHAIAWAAMEAMQLDWLAPDVLAAPWWKIL